MAEDNETYLGDGLYASFDGYQIQLRAPRPELSDFPREVDHVVYLEPSVLQNFLDYVDMIRTASAGGKS